MSSRSSRRHLRKVEGRGLYGSPTFDGRRSSSAGSAISSTPMVTCGRGPQVDGVRFDTFSESPVFRLTRSTTSRCRRFVLRWCRRWWSQGTKHSPRIRGSRCTHLCRRCARPTSGPWGRWSCMTGPTCTDRLHRAFARRPRHTNSRHFSSTRPHSRSAAPPRTQSYWTFRESDTPSARSFYSCSDFHPEGRRGYRSCARGPECRLFRCARGERSAWTRGRPFVGGQNRRRLTRHPLSLYFHNDDTSSRRTSVAGREPVGSVGLEENEGLSGAVV